MNLNVDEDLYSRQLHVIGIDAMKKLMTSSVLISGMGGLGVEIAKNVILAGVKNVTIHDTKPVHLYDLASQYYLNESMIGKNRAEMSFSSLASLNNYVTVSVITNDLTKDMLSNYNCIVLTDNFTFDKLMEFSQFCHDNGTKLIVTDTRGVFGYIFTDLGANFVVTDPSSERPSRFLISMITNNENGVVTAHEDNLHDLSDGDFVYFEEIEGMTELNGREFQVKVINARQFSIGDTRNFGQYTCEHRSGYGNQIFKPKIMNFVSFSEALSKFAEYCVSFDYTYFNHDPQVMLAFLSYYQILQQSSNDVIGFDNFIENANQINDHFHFIDTIDLDLMSSFSKSFNSVIAPTCAVFGGIAGQEIIKALSGKFIPIHQFVSFGYIDALQKEFEYNPQNDRYDPYRMIFGNEQQEKISKLRYFMVGAGAIGCELLKNWAMMGVSSHQEGLVIITDMDSIEKSNLNRQFLFRDSDIGQMKSSAAAKAVKIMNPDLHIEAHSNRVGPETELLYNDMFYSSLNGLCNALDNIPARLYMDDRSKFYQLPLLESGTLGPKAHYQIILPNMTNTYASYIDPPEKDIPLCVLHNYPTSADHCCLWSRNAFIEYFTELPQQVNDFINNDRYVETMQKTNAGILYPTLKSIHRMMIQNEITDYKECVRWARAQYDALFVKNIENLLTLYPLDSITSTGLPYWTGNKRAPSPIPFDITNADHINFIRQASIIFSRIMNITNTGNEESLIYDIGNNYLCYLPETKEYKENETPVIIDVDETQIQSLLQELQPVRQMKLLNPETFEKDDDTNGHIDFITATSNIRASNYKISGANRTEYKRIAGKIVPAIATTTAMVCGFVTLEMYKVHSVVPKPLTAFRNGFINLGISMFSISQPEPINVTKCPVNNLEYTMWTTWDINGNLTMSEFINAVKEQYNVNIEMMSYGNKMIYPISAEYLNKKLPEVLITRFHVDPFDENKKYFKFDAICTDDNGIDVVTPSFRLIIK